MPNHPTTATHPMPTHFKPTPGALVIETGMVDRYHRGVDKALALIGHPGALVTDIAQVFDFFCLGQFDTEAENQVEAERMAETLLRLGDACGRAVTGQALLWEIGRDVEQFERVRTRH